MDRTLASLNLVAVLAIAACDPAEEVELRSKSHHHDEHHHGKDIYPDEHWKKGKPQHHGLSPSGLAEMVEIAEELDSTCLMVIHDGVLVKEWYAPGFGPDTVHDNLFSITKSVTGTLVGIAREKDMLDLDDEVSDFIEPWDDSASEDVTVRDLLANDSGRFWSFESDYMSMMMQADHTQYAIGLDQAVDPGDHWEYNNAAVQTLEAVLEEATGDDVEEFAQTRLFERIGMDATLARDPAGNPLLYQGMSTSCADIARFGYLMLRKGKWKNKQIVPEQWVKKATKSSTDLNDAYGFLWWLNREGHVVEPSFPLRSEYEGRLVPAGSQKLFFAAGAFGQFVAIDPEDEYVVVRLQNVTDIQEAFATDPDPVGIGKLNALMTAFEEAKF